MKKLFFHYLLPSAFLLAIIFYSCANPVAPTGGGKDVRPPGIDSLNSTPNPSINFNEKTINLTFDEWVTLSDAFNQIVISPPLEHRLNARMKKKTLVLEFDENEKLKDSTTYIISLGNSIKDFREGNIPPDMKFVFSTGPVIDSLKGKGVVVDVETGKPEKDVLVMLYENLNDSIVKTEKPYYFAKTNEQGIFNLEYMKAGTYKAFALVDNNYNYLFDLPNEKIGFMKETVRVTDSTELILSFKIFTEEQSTSIIDQELRKRGKVQLVFNKEPKDITLEFSDNFISEPYFEASKDSINIWYSDTDSSLQRNIYLSLDKENYFDTINFKIPTKKNPINPKLVSNTTIIRPPVEPLFFEFNNPISKIDTSKIFITRDSLPFYGLDNISITDNPRILQVDFESEENKSYVFNILPSAIENMFGNTTDTLTINVSTPDISAFGDLNLTVIVPDSTSAYIVRLLDKKEKQLDEQTFSNLSSFKKTYKTLAPGKYSVIVIEDSNANGKRDSGNYIEKRQPERIFKKQLDELRKNWELDAEVKVAF